MITAAKRIALLAGLALAAPAAQADPVFGFGFTFTLEGDLNVGVKVFTNDSKGAAASLGLDYNLTQKALRPNVGVSYLNNQGFLDLNYGFGLGGSNSGVGIGIGGLSKNVSSGPVCTFRCGAA
ncbi:MAG: hypothetical protein JXR13_17075 [Thalassovita sp.]